MLNPNFSWRYIVLGAREDVDVTLDIYGKDPLE